MALNVVLGPTAKLDVGPGLIPYRVISGRITDRADVNETSDSETLFLSKEFNPLGMIALMLQIEVQLDTDIVTAATVRMFAAPLSVQPGNRIPMRLWPEGRGAGAISAWNFYQVIIGEGSTAFVVRGSTPQGGSINAQSTGYYKRPYETDLGGTGVANVITR